MGAELSHRLGYSPGKKPAASGDNCRNGYTKKTLLGEHGEVGIAVPHDREGGASSRSWCTRGRSASAASMKKIISMYARGMSARQISQFLQEQYHVEVSPELISSVTAGVLEEV